MNNYQQSGFPQNNQTFYPNQPNGGGMPPKKDNNKVLMIALISLVAVLLIVVVILAVTARRTTQRNVYVPATNPGVQTTVETEAQSEKEDASKETDQSGNKTASSEAKATGEKYSRKNPAPVGVEQVLDYKDPYNSDDDFKVSVTITETIRGEAALLKIKEANQFNDAPDDGYEYVLAKVRMTVLSLGSDKAFDADDWDFTSFSSNNEEIKHVFAAGLEPELGGKLYEEASTEGWMVLLVKADDANPKVAYHLDYDGTGGIWFALQ